MHRGIGILPVRQRIQLLPCSTHPNSSRRASNELKLGIELRFAYARGDALSDRQDAYPTDMKKANREFSVGFELNRFAVCESCRFSYAFVSPLLRLSFFVDHSLLNVRFDVAEHFFVALY